MATVRKTAETAIPIKPIRWSGLLPICSTRNNCIDKKNPIPHYNKGKMLLLHLRIRLNILMLICPDPHLVTYRDHSEGSVDHSCTNGSIDRLGHSRSLKNASWVVEHLKMTGHTEHSFVHVSFGFQLQVKLLFHHHHQHVSVSNRPYKDNLPVLEKNN